MGLRWGRFNLDAVSVDLIYLFTKDDWEVKVRKAS